MLAVFLLCAAFALSGTEGRLPFPPGVEDQCPPGWSAHGYRCFNFINSPRTWADAERYCSQFNANLASIHDTPEHRFVQELVRRSTGRYTRSWIGGTDVAQPFFWIWTDGSMFNYQEWASGEPNNGRGVEFCLEMNYGGGYRWNDLDCGSRLPFVCAI